jgi:hypothetical protein
MADVTVEILTPATSFNLMTLDELKKALGITSGTPATDDQWNWLIESNSVAIAGLINRVIAKEECEETWREVQNQQRIYLTHFPVKAADIDSVTTNGGNRLDYELEEASGKLQIFTAFAEPVVVHYTGGYDLPDEAPMDLKQCCVLMAATWKAQLAMVQVTGVKMIAHKEARVMFHTPTTGGGIGVHGSGVPPAVEAILTGYTRFWV